MEGKIMWITSKPVSEIYLEVSDLNLNVDNLESDTLLVVAAVETNSSDVRLVDASVKIASSDVRLVDASVKVNSSDVRLVDASVKVASSDVRLVDASVKVASSDTRLVDSSIQTNYSDVRVVIGALNDHITGSNTDVLVSDATTNQIAMISDLKGASVLNISIENSDAGNILDAFEVGVRANASAAFQTVASIASDYTTSLQWPLLGCGGDLTTLDSDTAYTLTMACGGLNAVRLKASCNATTTTISSYWGAR